MSKSLDILKEGHILRKEHKIKAYEDQKEEIERVRQRFNSTSIRKTDDIIVQLEEIIESSFECNF